MPPAARPSSRHRFLVAFSTLVVILLGFFALGRLPIDLLPSRDAPQVRVQVSVPGVVAPVIEEKITRRLEHALNGATGVTAVESVTQSGSTVILLHLKHRREADAVRQDVTARLEKEKSSWPASIDPPTVSTTDPSSLALEFAITSRQRDLLSLRDWVEDDFVKRLRELSGIATVDIEGGVVREVLVTPNQRLLAGSGLSFSDVLRAIRNAPDADAGTRSPPAKGRDRRLTMPSGNIAAVAAIPVALPSGESIPLSEVAKVTLTEEVTPSHFHFDGEEAIKVTVHRLPAFAKSDVIERTRAHIEWMRANRLIPDGVEVHPLTRQLAEARQSLRHLAVALISGVSLALFATYLFLGTGRRTLIVGVVIVASLQATFVAMGLSRLALDVMTLGGLALGAGLFGSGVMLMFENIARPVPDGVIVADPVLAMALVLPVALLPVLFAGGELGTLFGELVLVFSGAWLVSALLAMMLVPSFDARKRRRENEQWNSAVIHAIARARQVYGGLLRRLLRYRSMVLASALVLLGSSIAVYFDNSEKIPPPDDWRGENVVLHIQGPDARRLALVGDDIVRRLRTVPDLRDIKNSAQAYREEPVLRMDESRANELGIDIFEAGKALAMALHGIPAGSFRDAEHRYDIWLRLPPETSGTVTALGRILLLGELNDRPAVHLSDVATLEQAISPAQIHRYDGTPMIEVTASLADGSSLARALTRVRELAGNFAWPAGYRLSYGLPGNAMAWHRSQGLTVLGWALLFVFVMQAMWYRSFRMATVVSLTAVTSLAGAVAALLFLELPMTSAAWLGLYMLLGITASYATASVTHFMALEEQGVSGQKKVMRAAKHQFRPLLLVTLLAQLGMLSLMWVNGAAIVLHHIMITLSIGLVFSLLMNLFLAPVLYLILIHQEQTPDAPRL